MVKYFALLFLILLPTAIVAQPDKCAPPGAEIELGKRQVKAGRYDIELVVTGGPGAVAGARVRGELHLTPTASTDKSLTKEVLAAADEMRSSVPLFGFTDLDFSKIGVHIRKGDEKFGPDPRSRDPIYPGVLVRLVDFLGIKNQPVLLINTVSNRRDGVSVLDGGGIGLRVHAISDGVFTGRWSNWGSLATPEGYFCAQRILEGNDGYSPE